MNEFEHAVDVGVPDPELRTSPIAEETDDETETLRQEVPGEAVCYFNNKSFKTGAYIKSGTSILRCDYGIWIPAGPSDPDNP
jgi:hypothetical protein